MKDRSFVVGMVLIVLFTIAGTAIPIFGVVNNISPSEMAVLIHTFIGQNIMEVQMWINTEDNLLTLLGTIGGLIVSGGFWTWRKGIAFKKGFDTGFCRGRDCSTSFVPEDQTLLLKRAGDALEGLQQKHNALLDEHGKRVQELIELKEADEKRQYEFQMEKQALQSANKNQSNELIKWRKDLQKERGDEKREWEIRLEKERNSNVEFGERQAASRIVSHLLTTGQLFYSLDSKTGMVSLQLMGNAKVRESLPESEIKWLIDLSGLRQPNQMLVGKVYHGSGQQTACFDNLIKAIQTSPPLPTTDKEAVAQKKTMPCVWCLDTQGERYNEDWCKVCGPITPEQRNFFEIIGIGGVMTERLREAFDMSVREFIKKYPQVRPSSGGEWGPDFTGENESIYYTQTVRRYIKVNGMFRKA